MSRTSGRRAISPSIVLGVMRGLDLVIVVVVALLAYFVRHDDFIVPGRHDIVIGLAVLLTAYVLHVARLYRFDALPRLTGQINKLLVAVPLIAVALIGLGFFTKTSVESSRIWIGLWFTFSFAGFVLMRTGVRVLMERWHRQGRLIRNVVVVGAGETGRRLVEHL